ncbi:MAG: hypothetical protein HW416_704 [Chloroflexi bacterium]|nr:hypothetical protein [Chloroflexota bacterium]
MTDHLPATVESVEQGIRDLAAGPPDRSVVDLTAVANRAIIELNKIARVEAAGRRGQADWGAWARLANAVRGTVLQVATIRDSLKVLGLAAASTRSAPPSSSTAEDGGKP